jgi:hypothetical protein
MSNETTPIPGDYYLFGMAGFLIRLIARRWLFILGLPVLAMALAYIATGFQKPVFPGQASLQIGKFGGTDIQSRNAVADRINSQPFKEHVLQALNASGQSNSIGPNIVNNLSAQTNQFSDYVTINARANTAEDITKVIQAAAGLIQSEHEKIAAPGIDSLRSQLDLAKADMARLSTVNQDLATGPATEPDKKASDADVPATLDLHQRDSVMRDQLLQVAQAMSDTGGRQIKLTEQLSPAETYPTHLLDNIYVGRAPISPRRGLITAAVGAAVFFACLLWALFRVQKVSDRR